MYFTKIIIYFMISINYIPCDQNVINITEMDAIEKELKMKIYQKLSGNKKTLIEEDKMLLQKLESEAMTLNGLEKTEVVTEKTTTSVPESESKMEPSSDKGSRMGKIVNQQRPKSNSLQQLRLLGSSGIDVCRRLSIRSGIESCSCSPRATPLDVSSESLLQNRLFPMCVEAKRCAGYCPGKKKCIAAEKTMVPFPSIELSGGVPGCRAMLVEEHVTCSCVCSKKSTDCTESQIFNDQTCMCHCPDDNIRIKCRSKGKIWDEKNCLCKCKRSDIICSTGNVFDEDKCRCVASSFAPEIENILRSMA